MEALRIVAHTPAGFASADPWSPAIENIVAYWHLRERVGAEEFALRQSDPRTHETPEDLPLGREESDGLWWWQCSAPLYRAVGEHRRAYHRRFDQNAGMTYLPEDTKRILVSAGPYKNYRNVRVIRLTPRVEWHVIGDEAALRQTLRLWAFLGSGSAQGCGRLRGWEICPDGDPDLARFARPLPRAFAERHGRAGILRDWATHPSVYVPENHTLCIMPMEDHAL